MFIYLNKKIAIPNQVKLRCAQWNTEHVRAAERGRARGREGGREALCVARLHQRAHGHAYETLAHLLSLARGALVPRQCCA